MSKEVEKNKLKENLKKTKIINKKNNKNLKIDTNIKKNKSKKIIEKPPQLKKKKKVVTSNQKNNIKEKSKIIKIKLETKNILIKFLISLVLVIIVILSYYFITTKNEIRKLENLIARNEIKEVNYHDYYFNEVLTLKKKVLYKTENDKLVPCGILNQQISLKLERDKWAKEGYFKIKNSNYYINYQDLKESSFIVQNNLKTYQNYIPFNQSVVVTNPNFYLNDKVIFELLGDFKFPILIKENNYYGIIFNEKLYYLKKDEVKVIEENNTNLKYTKGIAVLTYHYTYDSNSEAERKECRQIICLSDKKFREHMEFIKNEGFYTATLNDLEMFIDGKIRLPEKTVVITIDDGYYIPKTIEILEDLNLHATLFLVGNIAEITKFDYNSPNLEIHSHTYNLHYVGACSGGQGSPLKCLAKDKILADLKKSRESLNNTKYFCYPFFEYNDYAINILKEAGFTMAFAGTRMKVRNGINKYKVPRYGIVNTTTINDLKSIIY